MAPQPAISPHLDKSQRLHSLERRGEIVDYVLRMVPLRLVVESAEQVPARDQAGPQLVDCPNWVDEMLEYVHRQHHVEFSGRHPLDLGVDEGSRHAPEL